MHGDGAFIGLQFLRRMEIGAADARFLQGDLLPAPGAVGGRGGQGIGIMSVMHDRFAAQFSAKFHAVQVIVTAEQTKDAFVIPHQCFEILAFVLQVKVVGAQYGRHTGVQGKLLFDELMK